MEDRGNRAPGNADTRPWTALALGLAAACAVAALQGPAPALALLLAVGATWLLVPHTMRFALARGAVVSPGGRSVHSERTPLLGGLAIVVPIVVALVTIGGARFFAAAAGCLVLAAVGALDDLRGVRPTHKLCAQIGAALLLYLGGYRFACVQCPVFGGVEFDSFGLVALVFWVLLVTNAVNLMDGLDGLAGGIGLVALLACIVLGYGGAVPAVAAGALIGFLRFNLPPARVFLGDAGSVVLGFMLSALLLHSPGGVNLTVALGVLALPMGDVALSTLRRWLRGKPIFSADRGHVHHLLLSAWGAPERVVAGLLGLVALSTFTAVLRPDLLGFFGVTLLWLTFAAYLLNLAGARLRTILEQRKPMKRVHLLGRYAGESLRLAESRSQVESILERVAEDLGLASLRLRDIRIGRSPANGNGSAAEGWGDHARWRSHGAAHDPIIEEERHTVLCELLRIADARLQRMGGAGNGRPRVHFVVRSADDLLRIAPVVRACRTNGALNPVIINAGRRDALDLESLPESVRAELEPEIDLDVPITRDVLETGQVMDRFDALLDVLRPATLVVVGESNAAVACALVARKRNVPVAHLDAPGTALKDPVQAAFNRSLVEALSDQRVCTNGRIERKAKGPANGNGGRRAPLSATKVAT